SSRQTFNLEGSPFFGVSGSIYDDFLSSLDPPLVGFPSSSVPALGQSETPPQTFQMFTPQSNVPWDLEGCGEALDGNSQPEPRPKMKPYNRPRSARSLSPARDSTVRGKNIAPQSLARPFSLRVLPDGFVDALIDTMSKQTDSKEHRQSSVCAACALRPPKGRDAAQLVFSKRHVEEVHVSPTARRIIKGDVLDDTDDALWIVMIALRARRRSSATNKPSPAALSEANSLINTLRLPCANRPLMMDVSALRGHADLQIQVLVNKLTCPGCDSPLSRPDSLARHIKSSCPAARSSALASTQWGL
ncbi:hypothetical protein DL93DRAFT_2080831, partial [Clavulina sp. PMI_390]